MFTQDRDMVDYAKAGEETGLPIVDFALSLKNIGLSLVNNTKKKEIAYIGITQWAIFRVPVVLSPVLCVDLV